MTIPDFDALLERTDAPPGSSWGVFDTDPERGTANFAQAHHILLSRECIRTGEVFSLDLALDAFNPALTPIRASPRHEITSHRMSRDDVLRDFHPQASSQIDGLRHRRASGWGFFNGTADDLIVVGDPFLGVQRWAEKPIVGRGVVVDVAAEVRRRGAPIDHHAGEALDIALVDQALDRQGAVVQFPEVGLGQTTGACRFRYLAVEVLPPMSDSPYAASSPEDGGMMHQALFAKLGLPLGDLWNLGPLARHGHATGHWDAFLTVKPLHVVGGVGSPPNATAVR